MALYVYVILMFLSFRKLPFGECGSHQYKSWKLQNSNPSLYYHFRNIEGEIQILYTYRIK